MKKITINNLFKYREKAKLIWMEQRTTDEFTGYSLQDDDHLADSLIRRKNNPIKDYGAFIFYYKPIFPNITFEIIQNLIINYHGQLLLFPPKDH